MKSATSLSYLLHAESGEWKCTYLQWTMDQQKITQGQYKEAIIYQEIHEIEDENVPRRI